MSGYDAVSAEARASLSRFADDVVRVLSDELVGVYVHGSLAFGCFNPARSDIDVIVVTSDRLDDRRRRKVAAVALQTSLAPYPLELTVLSQDDLRPWRHPTPYDFHFAESLRETTARGEPLLGGADADLAGHIAVLRERGQVICGRPIVEVFPTVPRDDFLDSILRDLAWISRPETRMGGRIYGVLNACRVLAYVSGAGILSKAEAAEWALGEVRSELRPTLRRAAAAYAAGGDEPCTDNEARCFVRGIAHQVGKLTAPLDR